VGGWVWADVSATKVTGSHKRSTNLKNAGTDLKHTARAREWELDLHARGANDVYALKMQRVWTLATFL